MWPVAVGAAGAAGAAVVGAAAGGAAAAIARSALGFRDVDALVDADPSYPLGARLVALPRAVGVAAGAAAVGRA